MISHAISEIIEEKIYHYSHFSDYRDYIEWRNSKFKPHALTYASLRDFGEVNTSLISSDLYSSYDKISNFLLKNRKYRRNIKSHNIIQFSIFDPHQFYRFNRSVFKILNVHEDKIDSYNIFWSERSKHFSDVLQRLPKEIILSNGINKFFRAFFGCVSLFYFWNKGKTPSNEFLNIAYLYSLSFLILDGYFDSAKLCPKEYRNYIFRIMRDEISNKNYFREKYIPSSLFYLYTSILDEIKEYELFNKNREIFLNFIESQFDESINSRLNYSNNLSSLISSSGRQAYFSRYCAHRISGASEYFLNKKALFQSGVLNQITNDIEGFTEDKGHFCTIPTSKELSCYTIASFFSEAEKFKSYVSDSKACINRVLGLRLLEVFRETCHNMRSDNFLDVITKWNSKGQETLCESDLKYISSYRSIFFRLHREDFPLKNLSQSSRRVRNNLRRKQELGQRRLWNIQDLYAVPLEVSIEMVPLSDVAKYSLCGKAQRLRPMIFLMCISDGNFKRDDIIRCAVGIELFHSASLIIDDLPSQDNSSHRRNRKSAHKEFTVHEAELSAFEILAQAYKNFSDIETFGVSKRLIDLSSKYFSGIFGVNRGQNDDIKLPNKDNVPLHSYIRIISRKTGLGFSFPILAASYFNSSLHCKERERVARYIGMIYQIADDIEDNDIPISRDILMCTYSKLKKKIEASLTYQRCEKIRNCYSMIVSISDRKIKIVSDL